MDDYLFNDNEHIYYEKKSIYILHYIYGKNICVSYGILNRINNYDIIHKCSTDNGSSGSPIINLENNKVIGIHKQGSTNFNFNKGTLLKYPLNDFIKKYNKNKNNIIIDEKNINKNNINEDKKITNFNDDIKYIKNIPIIREPFKLTNGIDLSHKKGFKNFDLPESSRLNSIIQMLTSIKEIYDFILADKVEDEYFNKNNKNKIKRFNHIYVLTSFFSRALTEIYDEGGPTNPSLKEMDIVIKFLSQTISKQNNTKSTYDYILFILNQLHEELISYEDNVPRSEKLISFESPFNKIDISKNVFFNYYNKQYSKSIISDLFNWVLRKNKTCNHCKKTSYSFQAFPIIAFNLDSIFRSLVKNKENIQLDLATCFKSYFSFNHINDDAKEKCTLCNNNSRFSLNYSLETSPKYFIIVINRDRSSNINLFYSEKFELPLEKDIQCSDKKYELIGVIRGLDSRNEYCCVIKNSEEEKNDKIFEEWISFKDENISRIYFEQSNFEKEKEVLDTLNAKILIYKAIKDNN